MRALAVADSNRPSAVWPRAARMNEPNQTGDRSMPKRKAFRDAEGRCHVAGLLVHGKAGLGAGAAGPDEKVRPAHRETPGQAGSDG